MSGAWKWIRRIGLLFVAVVALEYVAVHLAVGARASWPSWGSAAPVLLVTALLAELGSLACFSGLTLALLARPLPPYPSVLAIDVTGNGASHVAPGGGATAAALRVRLYDRLGVEPGQVVGVAAVQYAVTVAWLLAVLLTGLVVTVPSPGTAPLVRTAAVLAAVVLTALAGLVAVLAVRPDQVVHVASALATRLRLVRPESLERLARTLIGHVHLLVHSPRAGRRALAWGAGYWILDAASLHLSVWACGDLPDVGGLLTTYALVSLLALLPVTPGGLGLVEGVAIPLLVSFGTPHDSALLGVLTWRLFGFWLTIPLGLAAYLWLRATGPVPARHGTSGG